MTLSQHPGRSCAGEVQSSDIPSVGQCLNALATPIRFLKGVGPKRAADLETIGLRTIEDLLYHLPFRYEDRRWTKEICQAVVGARESFIGRVANLRKQFIPHRRASMLSASLTDETGTLGLFWYRAPVYLVEGLRENARLLVHGQVQADIRVGKRIVHPEFEVLDEANGEERERILPIYLHPAGISVSMLRRWIALALIEYGRNLPNLLPAATRDRQRLLTLAAALTELHQPSPTSDTARLNAFTSVAHRSIIFEELYFLQLGTSLRSHNRVAGARVTLRLSGGELAARMRELLPFTLTGAQERVLREIQTDIKSSRAIQRLVQGDVGSGKTIVAWLASLHFIEAGYQVVWMAPTELLAEQHFRNITRHTKALHITAELLTGSLRASARKRILAGLEGGDIQFLVGTHSLIQEGVRVPRLGLGVIDEQHRFGVVQRLLLKRLQLPATATDPAVREPHILVMSATPIPRSLAMVLYGDLDISILDELPPGRKPIRTKVCYPRDRRVVYEAVLRELRQRHQAFIIYPLVETSEELTQVRDATQMAQKMREGVFKEYGVGLVHGKMSNDEREKVMRSFRDGAIGVLVATTVVEVGIDIPNATVMVIEHAERFGLSQLHQLRGRIGRGSSPGYCLLINRAPNSPLAAERLRVMEKEHDGFKIAEADLRLRGPGEFLGTRQSGIADFRLANLLRDAEILIEARNEAQLWVKKDPGLTSPESAGLREVLMHRWGQRLQFGTVG
jgi:ATP-dependent DNA helicase RecG